MGNGKASYPLFDEQIQTNKLRVEIARRFDRFKPPMIDPPNLNLELTDLLNIDIKLPSEHTVCGKRYDAEM